MSVSVMIGKMLKILLVDDSEFILQRVQHLLAGMEQIQEVRTATSAEEANQLIEAYNPSLIYPVKTVCRC